MNNKIPIIIDSSAVAAGSHRHNPHIVPGGIAHHPGGFSGDEYHSDAYVRDQVNYEPAHINFHRSDSMSSRGNGYSSSHLQFQVKGPPGFLPPIRGANGGALGKKQAAANY